jgi:hypothetical protein
MLKSKSLPVRVLSYFRGQLGEDFQQHRQQARQRDQILASLEQQLQEGVEGTKAQGAKAAQELHDFRRALANGEKPKLHRSPSPPITTPGDNATLLQADGIELLDVKTLMVLRDFETVARWGLSRMAHYQKLSDELIAPNLGQDAAFFYEDEGRNLRERFDIYPEALQARLDFFNELQQKQMHLLSQIQSERRRR